ncbi:ABC transporter permease [Modestobacter sp. VKM Ac-2986]|uniref:ABC transporter permease n=1 Tax=Modestobacter sp. VKM Ac-2986 TaxID=3004140 RepID=UPI0022AB8467|nr:ABC transporter permease [Modestobacter sp. VKM Ac-2986]MCZ2830869.1 ABC transporter permease [Modestobacter sp. VKM Ac-2986]
MSDHLGPWTENTARGMVQDRAWTALWRSRDLIWYFAVRDVKLRYRQAVLGAIWVLAQPIASVVVFTLVFSRLAGVSSQGVPYPVFALVGMVSWTYFSTSVTAGGQVLVANASLVSKVYFPRMAAPAAALLSPGVDLAVSLVLVEVATVVYGVGPTWRLLAAPLWLVLMVVTALGAALWLSALNVRYRDVQHAVGPVLQVLLFASPVAYAATALSGWQAQLYAVNPMVGVIALGRWSFLGTPWPGWQLLVSVVSAGVLLVSGVAYFNRAQRSFADVI